MPERTDTERFLNSGVEVETNKLGKVTVKELSLESLLNVLEDIISLLNSQMANLSAGAGDPAYLVKALANPQSLKAIKKIMANATSRAEDEFTDMGMTDWLKLLVALKQVMDWQEIKELFFQVVPKEYFQSLSKTLPN